MSATYSIYTSPKHQPLPDHLPTLIVTPHGKPHHVLYTYLHTNCNLKNYLLTPSDQGDLCVAKLIPQSSRGADRIKSSASSVKTSSSSSSNLNNSSNHSIIRCEASRNLRWTIKNEGIQNPVYKLTLPNPENPQLEQPLFQVSRPNPNSPWWTLFYFTYAGHLIPPKRIEFGRIVKNQPKTSQSKSQPLSQGETMITVTGKTDEERAVWKTLGEGNEDMVEWVILCAALNVLDDEIAQAAAAAGVRLNFRPSHNHPPLPRTVNGPRIHPTGQSELLNAPPIRPAVYQSNRALPQSSFPGNPPGQAITNGSYPVPQTRRNPDHNFNQSPPSQQQHSRTVIPTRSPSSHGHQASQQPINRLASAPRQNAQLPDQKHYHHPIPPNELLSRGQSLPTQRNYHPAPQGPRQAAGRDLDIFSESADLAYARGPPQPRTNLHPSSSNSSKALSRAPPVAGLRAMAQQAGMPASQQLTSQALYQQQQAQINYGRQNAMPAPAGDYSSQSKYQANRLRKVR